MATKLIGLDERLAERVDAWAEQEAARQPGLRLSRNMAVARLLHIGLAAGYLRELGEEIRDTLANAPAKKEDKDP